MMPRLQGAVARRRLLEPSACTANPELSELAHIGVAITACVATPHGCLKHTRVSLKSGVA
jgi:hypothetical protein